MIERILHIISIWIIVVPLIAGIINYQGLNRDSKWIFVLILLALFPQILTSFFFRQETALLNISYNLYSPLEFMVLFIVFRNKYEFRRNRNMLGLSGLTYIGFSVYFVMTKSLMGQFLNYWPCINNLIYIFWILLFLQEQYHSEGFAIYKKNPFAWYILGLIIYAPCTLIEFCLYYYVRHPEHPVLMNLWVIQSICNILLYLLFTAGLFISKREPIQREHEANEYR